MDARVEAYLDGRLPADERSRFEQHLEASAHWRQQVHLAERIQDELNRWPEPDSPPSLLQGVRQAIESNLDATRQRRDSEPCA